MLDLKLRGRTLAALATATLIPTLLGAAGCKDGGDDARPASEFPAFGEPANVNLLSAGDGDKRQLRWKGTPGTRFAAGIEMDMKMAMEADGMGNQDLDMKMTMSMAAEVTRAEGDELEITAIVEDGSLDMPQLAAAGGDAQDVFKRMLVGLEMVTTTNTQGTVSSSEMTGGEGLDQLMQGMDQSFEIVGIAFPAEAIGVGARWEVLESAEVNGMKARVLATYELTELSGDEGRAKVTLRQFADPQPIEMPMATGELKKLDATGSGEMAFDLNRPGFAVADVKLAMDMDMKVEAMGQSMDLQTQTELVMTSTLSEPAPREGGAGTVAP